MGGCFSGGINFYSWLTRARRASWVTIGPVTPSRLAPAPVSIRMSERTRSSSTRHAGVASSRRKGALPTSTSACWSQSCDAKNDASSSAKALLTAKNAMRVIAHVCTTGWKPIILRQPQVIGIPLSSPTHCILASGSLNATQTLS